MTLALMQRAFADWLTDQPGSMAPWVGADAQPGLDIYHNAYRVQLTDCLRDMFEKTALWLGEDAFIAAARAHIEGNPPHGWTRGIYGEGFDAMLACVYADDPEVAELAWLDRALAQAFEGPDAELLALDALADMDWDRARLHFVPTLRTGVAMTNAGSIWSALSAQDAPPAGAMLPEPGAMLVWRQGFTPCFRTIEAGEAQALAMMRDGAMFGQLCALLIDRQGEAAGVAQAGAYLGQWIGDGLIAAVDAR